MKNVRYEYDVVSENGDVIRAYTRNEARTEKRNWENFTSTKAKIIQRKYELKQERTVR